MKNLRELCKQYVSSDSISERNKLQEDIESICRKYLNTLYKIDLKFPNPNSIFKYTDYRDSSGYIEYKWATDNVVRVTYNDSWGYGGECCDGFNITFDDVEKFDEKRLEKEAIKKVRNEIVLQIKQLERALKESKEKLQKFDEEHGN